MELMNRTWQSSTRANREIIEVWERPSQAFSCGPIRVMNKSCALVMYKSCALQLFDPDTAGGCQSVLVCASAHGRGPILNCRELAADLRDGKCISAKL